jgi:hypothetical protein
MTWTAWIASKHVLLVHLPIAAALLSPLPILAAQRGGRGIRPWWTTCRYLAWAGLVGTFLALVSGHFSGQVARLVPPGAFWAPALPGLPYLFRLHQIGSVLSLALGAVCLRSLYRKRQEHQGIGFLSLLLGLAWSGSAFFAAYTGFLLVGHGPAPAVMVAPPQASPKAAPIPVPAMPSAGALDPESQAPLRALEYGSLAPMHPEPVKSPQHGNRWIRVWVSPGASDAYRAGQPLPPGTLVVMNSVEDRWGRPGYDPGPLYALEVGKDGKPGLVFYWPSVPEAKRGEVGGAPKAYWRDSHPGLQACQACHGQGAAPLKDRSHWMIPRRKPEAAASAASPAPSH